MRTLSHRAGAAHRYAIPALLAAMAAALFGQTASRASELRRTAIVRAVENGAPSTVNIRGQKTVAASAEAAASDTASRRVNGMGSGVIIDERGYIITNHHVIAGVSRIHVTLADETALVGRLVAHDPETDLAVIKVDPAGKKLKVIDLASSGDLMAGEPVVAIGNAYGYHHTVTRGIISALSRTVQVSEEQSYYNLIQTDAPINPGNSGGPLLNIDGKMIGINVAVRVGAQGIGFAIPTDKVVQVAADLISVKRLDRNWHGITAKPGTAGRLVVQSVEPGSPAEKAGLAAGDVVTTVDGRKIERLLDLERTLLGRKPGESVEFAFRRRGESAKLPLHLAALLAGGTSADDRAWLALGLRLESLSAQKFRRGNSRYRGGLAVTEVRPDGPAAGQGICRGDVLVGMHIWETISLDNVTYILNRSDLMDLQPVKFYILRGEQTLYGHMRLAAAHWQTARKE